MDIGIVLYDGFDTLDAMGPIEVLGHAASRGGDLEVRLHSLGSQTPITSAHGVRVEVDGPLEPTDPDWLLVPGGGWNDKTEVGTWGEAHRGEIPSAIAEAHEAGVTIASVCTGAMLLAIAGVLDGRQAVTHHSALDDLREYDIEVIESRVVDDGDIITAAGVTAGIDLGIHIVRRIVDAAMAESIADEIAYEPRGRVHIDERDE